MRLGTLSFGRPDAYSMDLSGKERLKIIQKVVIDHAPDFLCCSGHSLETTRDVETLALWCREQSVGTGLLVEVRNGVAGKSDSDKNRKEEWPSRHVMFFVAPNGAFKRLGPQIFAKSAQASRRALSVLCGAATDRTFEHQGKRFFALCCGEINALYNPRGSDETVFRPGAEDLVCPLSKASIILNPTHDWIKRFEPRRSRKMLSTIGTDQSRAVVCVSNWNRAKHQTPWALTMHHAFMNGDKVPPQICEVAEDTSFKYQEFELEV